MNVLSATLRIFNWQNSSVAASVSSEIAHMNASELTRIAEHLLAAPAYYPL